MSELQRIINLLQQQQIVGQSIQINFSFAGVTLPVESKDIVGTVIQSWLSSWMSQNNIQHSGGVHTQSWPDFILADASHLEVKAFDGDSSPNFDVANFDTYTRSLLTHPERLDTDHLIFEYRAHNGRIVLSNFWVKKIWEITGPSDTNILNLQVKQETVHNIRPKNWRNPRVSVFRSRRDFVTALAGAQARFHPERAVGWFQQVEAAYQRSTHVTL